MPDWIHLVLAKMFPGPHAEERAKTIPQDSALKASLESRVSQLEGRISELERRMTRQENLPPMPVRPTGEEKRKRDEEQEQIIKRAVMKVRAELDSRA